MRMEVLAELSFGFASSTAPAKIASAVMLYSLGSASVVFQLKRTWSDDPLFSVRAVVFTPVES